MQLWRINIDNYGDDAVKGAGQKGYFGFVSPARGGRHKGDYSDPSPGPFSPHPADTTTRTVQLDRALVPAPDDAPLRLPLDPLLLLPHRPLGRPSLPLCPNSDHPRPFPLSAPTLPPQTRHDLDPRPDRSRVRTRPPRRHEARPTGRATGRGGKEEEELDRRSERGRARDRGKGRRHLERCRQSRRDARHRRLDQLVRGARVLCSITGTRELNRPIPLSPGSQVLSDRYAPFSRQGRPHRQPTTSRHARLQVPFLPSFTFQSDKADTRPVHRVQYHSGKPTAASSPTRP